jgi:hypothetical protein
VLAGIEARPYMSVDVFAKAAIDYKIVAVGILAELTLVDVSVPATVGLKLAGTTSVDQAKSTLTLENMAFSVSGGVDVEFECLRGRLAAFVRFIIWDFEHTIFEWAGVGVKANIASFDVLQTGLGTVTVHLGPFDGLVDDWNAAEFANINYPKAEPPMANGDGSGQDIPEPEPCDGCEPY